jgi:hypothetical protein
MQVSNWSRDTCPDTWQPAYLELDKRLNSITIIDGKPTITIKSGTETMYIRLNTDDDVDFLTDDLIAYRQRGGR